MNLMATCAGSWRECLASCPIASGHGRPADLLLGVPVLGVDHKAGRAHAEVLDQHILVVVLQGVGPRRAARVLTLVRVLREGRLQGG